MNKLICLKTNSGKHGNFSRSRRQHGTPGKFFVICGNCGVELQSTKRGVFDTNSAKYRDAVDLRAKYPVTARLTETYHNMIPSGITIRVLIESALDAYTAGVIQLPYKT